MPDIKTLRRDATARLKVTSTTPELDAELLLTFALNQSRAFLYAHGDDTLEPDTLREFEALLAKRLTGVPMAYLLGEREFWSLPFYVTPSTLIPRPETELLVELVLEFFGIKKTCRVLELGVGTGAISVALATEHPNWNIIAVDKSTDALAVAEKNLARHHVNNIQLIQSDWFEALHDLSFDVIVSNPPYLAEDDPHRHQGDLRFEPKEALVGGVDGLSDLTQIIQNSLGYLKPGGALLLEHGCTQSESVLKLMRTFGYKHFRTWRDTNDNDRVTTGWK